MLHWLPSGVRRRTERREDFDFAVELLSLPKQFENRHGRIAATCSISNCGEIDSDFRQIAVGSSVLAAKTHGFEQISDVPLLFATRAGSGDAAPMVYQTGCTRCVRASNERRRI
ncbi:hypothetical protein [Caballeronia sp. INDeC2]|uniref:hypothetical protein n=1 Tax=Caballeronia sp. INDeC2 TaxID=2921747 RepID=UPI0020281E21|nr:hypothetical protein [Caballeronia sp. INDeC2]